MTSMRLFHTIALCCLLVSCSEVTKETKEVSPGWQVVTQRSNIPEAGGYHPFLWRDSSQVKVMIDIDTYSVTALPNDCVTWYGLDSRGFFMACGDHEPLLLQRDPDTQTGIKVNGDQLALGAFSVSIASSEQQALRRPPLSSSWRAETLRPPVSP